MTSKTAVAQASGESSWAALRYSNFRWMYIAQGISAIGTMMQIAAVNWHVWELTHDEIALGLVGLVRVAPIIVLSLLGGVIADALDRRRLMLVTQSLMLLFSVILAITTVTGSASLWVIYLMTAAISGLSAFDSPAWSALLPNLVPGSQVANAIRMNILLGQISAVVGPVLAGVMLAGFGVGAAYVVDALSFVPVVLVLILIRLPAIKGGEKREVSLAALREGLAFVRNTPLLWGTMLLDFFATFFASALALLPIYATDILHVGEFGYGLLFASPSIGATIAAVLMAQYGGRIREQGKTMLAAVAVFGIATVIFGLSTHFIVAALALAVTGFTDTISMVIRSSLRQLLTPDRLRGRMLSVNLIFVKGGPQMGEFEAGVMARAFGAPFSVVFGGLVTVLVVAFMTLNLPILREYRELPEPVGD